MSSKRKSFVLHKDSLDILSDLDDNQAGKLFKAIHAYQINDEIELDQITKMVFLPFKNQFVRDDGKYVETCERREREIWGSQSRSHSKNKPQSEDLG